MKERIRLLVEQAKVSVITTNGMTNILDGCYIVSPDKLEKFAELIVRECIRVGGPEDSFADEWFKAKADSVAKIKQHFGVEE